MKQFQTVFCFEYVQYLKSKAFRIVTIIGAILVVLVFFLPTIIGFFSGSEDSYATSSDLPSLVIASNASDQEIYQQAFSPIANVSFSDDTSDALCEQVKNSTYDAALISDTQGNFQLITANDSPFDSFTQSVQSACNQYLSLVELRAQNISLSDASAALNATANLSVVSVSGSNDIAGYILAYIMLILLLIAIMMYGQMVTMSIAGEKSTRTMEVLITYAKPQSLIFGKVFAACAAGLSQLLFFVLLGALSFTINLQSFGALDALQPLLAQAVPLIGYLILFFLLSFLSFCFLFGAVGSLVSRVEDVNAASTPVVIMALLVYFAGFAVMSEPNGTLAVVCSFVPLFSPTIMSLRLCMSTVPFWQVLTAIAINLLTIFATGWIGTQIYRGGVLLYGTRPSWKSVLKMLKSK